MSAISQADIDSRAPRQRILDVARLLFYRKGIRAVSVEEIAAAASTNKMTLYRHFESKDRLVGECLRALAAETDAVWADLERNHPGDPKGQLHAWVDHLCRGLREKDERGCGLSNAAVELYKLDHPARVIIQRYKRQQSEKLTQLCRDAGFAEPERFADEIFLLIEGARINVQSVGDYGPGSRFSETIKALIKSHEQRKI